MHNYYEVLIKNHIFDDITLEDMKALNECFKARILSYAKGEFIFNQGEVFENLGIVVDGIINITKEDENGNKFIFDQSGPGAVLDESITVKKDYRVSVGAEVYRDSDVVIIPFEKLITLCKKKCPFHVKLLSNIVRLIASNHNSLTLKIDYLSKKSVRHKLSSFLKYQIEKYNSSEFDITFDRKGLAEFLFVDRSALSRELGRMRKEKIIEFHKNHFKILNESGLKYK